MTQISDPQIIDHPNSPEAVNLFLKAIFQPTSQGFIPTVELRELDEWEWKYNVSDYLGVVEGIPPKLNTPNHLNPTSVHYFAPALFQEQNRLKEYFHSAAVLWADFDTPNPDPTWYTRLKPHPSAVIETSPGKYHCYWLLQEPERRLVVEDLNRRLAYNLGADHGCWNCNRLLRLPFGVHGKKDAPTPSTHPVILRYLDPELRYTPDDFNHLPANDIETAMPESETELLSTPMPITKALRIALYDKWADRLTPRLNRLLRTAQDDRSGALWQIWADCHLIGIPKTEAFQLAYDTPNDKFNTRRSHDQDLWKDVISGYAHASMDNRPVGVIEQLETIRRSQATGPMKIFNMGNALTREMLSVGEFFISEAPAKPYYMDKNTNRLYHLSRDDRETQKLFHDRYAINAAGGEFQQLLVACISAGLEQPSVKVHRLSHYQEDTNTIYLNRYDGFVYKVTKDGWEQVRNGEDRVLFVSPNGAQAWKAPAPDDNPTSQGMDLWDDLVFSSANILPQEWIEPREIRHIIRTWVLSMFFRNLMRVKPILFMHGEAGSGKTAVFKNIDLVLFGQHGGVNDLPEDRETYDFIVGNNDHVFFDNVDSWYRWLPDKLAITSTGYTFQKRRLYTDNDQLYYAVNCFVGLTARTPKFIRDDIAQRIIPVKVSPYADDYEEDSPDFIDEHTIITGVLKNRDRLWRDLLTEMVQILGELDQPTTTEVPASIGKLRMADFGKILVITCRLKEISFDRCVRFMKYGQASEAVDDDPMVEVLTLWLERPENQDRWVSASELLNEFQYYNNGALKEKIRTPIGLATRIGQYRKYFPHAGIAMEKQDRPKMYKFRTLTPEEREKVIDDD